VPRVELTPQRYRDLVEQSRGLICTHDLAGVLLSVNRAAADRLGYRPEDLVGRNLADLLAPAGRHLFPQYLDRIQQNSTDEGLMLVVTREGDERVWTYSNVRGREPGGPEYVLGHAHDITDIKRSGARAVEAEALRSVGQLALATAHEINNPLTVIIASLQRVIKSAEQIRDIVRNMSRITRLELSRQAPELPAVLDITKSSTPQD
jgi:PAS domain S-box-containing protein